MSGVHQGWAVAIRTARRQRLWSVKRLAQGLSEEARIVGYDAAGLDSVIRSIRRWEAGAHCPDEINRWLLGRVFQTSEQLFAGDPAPAHALYGETETGETIQLARSALASDMDDGTIGGIERAVEQLCRDYSTTAPAILLPAVRQSLTQIDRLLSGRLRLRHHRQLLVGVGWLHLLLAALHNDIGQREAAWVSRDAALQLGEQTGDSNVIAWAYETPSWFALWDGRAREALDYGEAGLRVAPPQSSGWIMNKLKVAQAHARLGDRLMAEREFDDARNELETWPEPEHPDHHFVFDPPKFHFYASSGYSWLRIPERVEAHAREVIRRSNDPTGRCRVPTRVSMSRLDLAEALLSQGQLDEALVEARRALEPFLRRDTVTRARQLDAVLRARWPNEAGVSDFHERLMVGWRALGSLQ